MEYDIFYFMRQNIFLPLIFEPFITICRDFILLSYRALKIFILSYSTLYLKYLRIYIRVGSCNIT